MDKALKDKFTELGGYIRDGGGTRRLVELLFMVEEMAPKSDTVLILVNDISMDIPREVHHEVQMFLNADKKIKAIKALRDHLGASVIGILAAKRAVELEGNWILPKIIYRDSPPVLTHAPHPLGCTYCAGYCKHPAYVDQMEVEDDAEEVFALDDTGSVEDCQPEDLDPHTLLVYDPLKVGDDADPQDTVNFGPDAIPSWKQGDDKCVQCGRDVTFVDDKFCGQCKSTGSK